MGEPHRERRPEHSPYKLGEDVVIEAFLLARTNFFIHANSSVANFVLCLNPALPHHDIYERYYWPYRMLDYSAVRLILGITRPVRRLFRLTDTQFRGPRPDDDKLPWN